MRQMVPRAVSCALAAVLSSAAAILAIQDGGLVAALLVASATLAFALRPEGAVLVAAAFVPLGAALPIATGVQVAWTELLIFTTTAGWLLRRAASTFPSGERAFRAWTLAFGATSCASALALWWADQWSAIPAPRTLVQWGISLVGGLAPVASPLRDALRLAAAAGMAAAIAGVAGTRLAGRAARLLLLSVCALGALSLYRVAEIALRSPTPTPRLVEVVSSLRIAPVIGDPNALGALFLLLTPFAFALCLSPEGRRAGSAAFVLLAAGAWLAGSRTTIAVTPLAMAGLVALRTGLPAFSRRAWWTAAALGVLTAALMVLPTGRHVAASTAWTIRRDFGTVTARMLVDDPVFGVGQSQYYRRSSAYMPPSLSRYYPQQNAHNQYFQVAGELGLLGAIPFLAMMGLVATRALRTGGRLDEAPGLAAGVLAFLAASMAQHPLLDLNVGGAFWIATGLLMALTRRAESAAPSRASALPWGMAVLAAALLPVQAIHRAKSVSRTGTVTAPELQRGQDESGGYWTSATQLTMYVPADAVHCDIRLRARGVRGEVPVTLHIDHRPAGAVAVERGMWRSYRILIPSRRVWPLQHHRLDIEWARRPGGRVAIDAANASCR